MTQLLLPGTTPTKPAPFRRMDAVELTSLVRKIAEQPELWRDRLEYSTTRRWWTQLIADPAVDVWLLTWMTEQGTELHDHGNSSAAFTVVQGELEEVRPTSEGSLSATEISPGHMRWVSPGAIHDVTNRKELPAVSIHAYSPPLSQMTFYKREQTGLTIARTEFTSGPEREDRE